VTLVTDSDTRKKCPSNKKYHYLFLYINFIANK